MDFRKLPLDAKLILMQEISGYVIDDMEAVLNTKELTKEQIGQLGLRQAINAGEGDTDLRVRFDRHKYAVNLIDELIVSLEAHVKNIKV